MGTNVKIEGIGTYIPKKVVKNDFFIEHFRKEENGNTEVEGLMKSLGREERHFAEKGESSLSMGYEASLDVLKKTGICVEDIDMIVFVSDTPEYTSPTNALMLNGLLNASKAHVVFDMNCNCTGMIVALDNVASYMKGHSNINKALVVSSMYASSVVRFNDSVTYPSFGDASTAVILSKYQGDKAEGILGSAYFTDANYRETIKLPAVGHSKELMEKHHKYYRRLEWNPFDFSFLADGWSNLIKQLFSDYNISDKDVAFYSFSQFSDSDNRKTLKTLGTDIDERYLFNANKYGYTGCSSPILALNDVWSKANDMKNKYIIFISVAAGYSMSAVLYKI